MSLCEVELEPIKNDQELQKSFRRSVFSERDALAEINTLREGYKKLPFFMVVLGRHL